MGEAMQRVWRILSELYARHPRSIAALLGTALLGGLSGIHALIGYTSAFRPLYVLPIWIATRMGGRVSGFVMVVLSTLVGTLSEWQLGQATGESPTVNASIRFVALGALMLLIAQVEQTLQRNQKLSIRDPLTGLLNIRALREFGRDALGRAAIRHLPMTIVMIDCDGFKQLNDTHGHKAGDYVLTLLARELQDHTRQTDLVARIGGDEFALVLESTTLDGARQIMRRIDDSFVAAAMLEGFSASLSIGYGSTADGYDELDAMLEIADRAMYRSKRRKKSAAFLK